MTFSIFIPGRPAAQGSKRHLGRGIMVESSKKVAPWRADVRTALIDAAGKPKIYFDGPVDIRLEFVLYRPASTSKRKTPPAIKKPDLDKLMRAVLDAVTSAGIWRDDSQVVNAHVSKRLAGIGEALGCRLTISQMDEITADIR